MDSYKGNLTGVCLKCTSHEVPEGSKILLIIPMSLSFHTSIFLISNSSVFLFGVNSFFPGKKEHKYSMIHKLTRSVIWFTKYAGFGNGIYNIYFHNQPRQTQQFFSLDKNKHCLLSLFFLWLERSFKILPFFSVDAIFTEYFLAP